ncbi:hypothetical protein GCM10014719_36530 [Planomonospora parontospora subsp. antibiotica]|nr:hypothetical protein GCM10014719_36530 [Planomonospora parontospora subsp. antibiotica]GII16872.1 hypothetical protein Ppa05_35980 [Planomonospora parontospora subsp. antibiotica]
MAGRGWPGEGDPLGGPPHQSTDDARMQPGGPGHPAQPGMPAQHMQPGGPGYPGQPGGPGYPGQHMQQPGGPSHHVQPAPAEQSSLVRPYAVTGGRTAPRTQLAMEALVSSATSIHHDLSTRTPEYQAISALCRQVRSVAEISAMLRIPLGVTRILVADMAAEGLVQLHQPQLNAGKPDLNLLERVLSGLRRL